MNDPGESVKAREGRRRRGVAWRDLEALKAVEGAHWQFVSISGTNRIAAAIWHSAWPPFVMESGRWMDSVSSRAINSLIGERLLIKGREKDHDCWRQDPRPGDRKDGIFHETLSIYLFFDKARI